MDDEDEIHLHVTYASHLDMDEAFCARMHAAIAAGARKCAGWRRQHAQNEKSKTRSNKGSGPLLVGQRLLVLVEAAFLAWRPGQTSASGDARGRGELGEIIKTRGSKILTTRSPRHRRSKRRVLQFPHWS
jgi:hypothetical protein